MALSAGCGEARFTADELIGELREAGAPLELGAPLESLRDDVEVFTVTFEEPEASRDASSPAPEEAHAHGSGSLTITEDAETGSAEYARCEGAASLLCFRAANAVIAFGEELEESERAELEDALRALAER